MPTSATKDRPTEKIRELNERLADVARDYKQVTVLDTYTLFANADGEAQARGIPRSPAPERGRLRQVAGRALAAVGHARLRRNRAGLVPTRRRLRAAVQRPRPRRLGLSARRPRRNGRWRMIKKWRTPAIRTCRLSRSSRSRSAFDGKTASADGRFRAMNGRLVVTTPTEGRRIQQLATTRDFAGDFTLKLDFRATPNADSGVFVRGRQLQCRDYPLAGPYKNLKNYKPQDWNELVDHRPRQQGPLHLQRRSAGSGLRAAGDRPDRPRRRPRADGVSEDKNQVVSNELSVAVTCVRSEAVRCSLTTDRTDNSDKISTLPHPRYPCYPWSKSRRLRDRQA